MLEEEEWVLLPSAEALSSTARLKGLDPVSPFESLTRALFWRTPVDSDSKRDLVSSLSSRAFFARAMCSSVP